MDESLEEHTWSKWVRRYFVLRICDKKLGTYVLDEFRKEDKRRLRKSLDLVRCVQIDSHLQLADSSCATTSRFGGFQWIFSLYFTKGTSSEKKTPLYFVSESEEKMKDWVYNLCRACRLEKETDEDSTSFTQQHPSHVEEIKKNTATLKKFPKSQCSTPRSFICCGKKEQPSAATSKNGTRLGPQYSSASSSTGVPVKRLALDHLSHMGSPKTRSVISETMENDSSGETIKLHGIVPYANSEGGFRSGSGFLPPAVDRSNKPAKLRLYDYEEEKVPEEMTIHGYNKSGNNFTRTPRTPQGKAGAKPKDMREPPKSAGPLGRSRELDYFNPVPLDRAHSLRSPAPSDIEYIKIDAEKTQAVKQSIAQRATIE
ncbi:hypothetical protein TELCIR_08502 [Teladorsagia circumcincta]|uniref:PH domain-containing protein n=1 Tax=Teladorsagia circumcincta TaxID=45464 RepID=A0A2G9UHE0_TELCI|nr:hypothetical protein TELCIR_08502 [Teladorsagia circumcincta]